MDQNTYSAVSSAVGKLTSRWGTAEVSAVSDSKQSIYRWLQGVLVPWMSDIRLFPPGQHNHSNSPWKRSIRKFKNFGNQTKFSYSVICAMGLTFWTAGKELRKDQVCAHYLLSSWCPDLYLILTTALHARYVCSSLFAFSEVIKWWKLQYLPPKTVLLFWNNICKVFNI